AAKSVSGIDRARRSTNGKNDRGIVKAIGDRLANAARVRDLREDLARAIDVPRDLFRAKFHNIEHHRAHLASSFYVSPFQRAALASIDGFGDSIPTCWGIGE